MSDKTADLFPKLISSINGAPMIMVVGTVMAGLVMYKSNSDKPNESDLGSLRADIPDKKIKNNLKI